MGSRPRPLPNTMALPSPARSPGSRAGRCTQPAIMSSSRLFYRKQYRNTSESSTHPGRLSWTRSPMPTGPTPTAGRPRRPTAGFRKFRCHRPVDDQPGTATTGPAAQAAGSPSTPANHRSWRRTCTASPCSWPLNGYTCIVRPRPPRRRPRHRTGCRRRSRCSAGTPCRAARPRSAPARWLGGRSNAVDVGQRAPDRRLRLPVDGEVVDDLAVRSGVGDLDGPLHMAEERRGADHRGEVGDEPGDREGQTTALAVAGDHDPVRIDSGQGTGRLDRPYRVGDQTAVVVAVRCQDAPGHRPGPAGATPCGSAVSPTPYWPACPRASISRCA